MNPVANPTRSRNAALRLVVTACALVGCLIYPKFAQAQTDSAQLTIEKIAIGFGENDEQRHYKVGLWTPVNVTLRGAQSEPTTGVLELESTDGDGFPSILVSDPVTVPAGATVRRQLMVRPGSQGGTINIRFRSSEDQVLAERSADLMAMLSTQRLWVEVGAALRTNDATRAYELEDEYAVEIAHVADLEDLPTHWFGYEAVDILFVSVADPAFRDKLRGNARVEALENWVKAGGRLILAAGAESAEAATLFDSGADPHPMLRFVPGTFERMLEVTQVKEIQSFADTDNRFEIGAVYRFPALKEKPGSNVKARLQNGTPLVIESAYGFGRVTFVALDWHRPPFLTWGARDRFINASLGVSLLPVARQTADETGQLSHSGLTDMASQLRGALDQFPNVTMIPFWAIALAIAGYIALIGPIDYFIVKRVLRRQGQARMEFTWITLPIWVLLVSGVAYWAANRTKGDNLHVNQLVVVDHDLQSGTVRGTCWFSVFSPSMQAFDVSANPSAALASSQAGPVDRNLFTTWMGLPGRVLGGMATDNSLLIGRSTAYRYGDDYARMQATPIPVWSSRCFTSRWVGADPSPPLEVTIEAVAGDPSGSIRNTSGQDLKDCLFAYGRWAFLIPELKDGMVVGLNSAAVKQRRELRDELNETQLQLDEESKQYFNEFQAYDVLGRDMATIAREMTFYEASGGKGYAQLDHRYQAFMDLTSQVDLDRGVLIGFVEEPAPVAQVNAESSEFVPHQQTWKCVRFVFDVPEAQTVQRP